MKAKALANCEVEGKKGKTPQKPWRQCVAVVCRVVCGLTLFVATGGIFSATLRIPLHHGVDAVPGQRLGTAVQKDVLILAAAPHQ